MKSRRLFILIGLTLALFVLPASAKDDWIQIRSKNFLLIGNAAEKDIRRVGTRLEEFRETFRHIFPKMNVASPVPINVIVFKNGSSYTPFKPRLTDGKIDTSIAGYFQSGEDVNYITLSAEGEDNKTFAVILHEYVHSLVKVQYGNFPVPAWFNEGLAEYYETFTIENNSKIRVGLPQQHNLSLLQQNPLTPLRALLNLTNTQLSNSGDRPRDLFYAQSWALIHYLMQSGRSDSLTKFMELLQSDSSPEKAFQAAFQTTYAEMEKQLARYIATDRYNFQEYNFVHKLEFDAAMHSSPLDEASVNSYLGDILAHTHRDDEAEPYLLAALKLQPTSSIANTTLGMMRMKHQKYDEAKKYLEAAISADQTNYRTFFDYAYILSQEKRDELGFVRELSKESTVKMRNAINKSVALNPNFAESYELLAFIALVNNEDLENAVASMQKALQIQPGNQTYALRLAEIYLRQHKYAEAGVIVDKIAKTPDDADMRQRAENLALIVRQRHELEEQQAAERKRNPGASDQNISSYKTGPDTPTETPMTEEEIAKASLEAKMRAVNQNIREMKPGEKRTLGHLQKIDCGKGQIAYFVKTPSETLKLASKTFQTLELGVFADGADKVQVGCDANLAAFNALITYKPATGVGSGELVAIEFVPNDFRLLKPDEIKQPAPRIVAVESIDANGVALSGLVNGSPPNIDQIRRDSIMQWIKTSLPRPAEGEKREIGHLDKIECSEKDLFFIIRTADGILRLQNPGSKPLPVRLYIPEVQGTVFDCSLRPIEFPAVFIYRPAPDAKSKTSGVILSLDFVPRSFVLE